MNSIFISFRLAGCVLLAATMTDLRAAATNPPPSWQNPLSNAAATNKPTAAERRARIEAWRAERGGTNRTVVAAPPENLRHLSATERRERLRATLVELREKKMSGHLTTQEQKQLNYLEAHPPAAPAATNTPAAHPPGAK